MNAPVPYVHFASPGVKHACHYEPDLNPTYQELATHYGTAVLPARPRKPRDKPAVENAVLQVERWILAPLRHRTFFGLDELNAAIAGAEAWTERSPESAEAWFYLGAAYAARVQWVRATNITFDTVAANAHLGGAQVEVSTVVVPFAHFAAPTEGSIGASGRSPRCAASTRWASRW